MPLLRSGDVFANRFEIDRFAGSGGMGTVYRARDRYTKDPVALKLLSIQPRKAADSEESDRFAREAQILSELRHPGIVSYVAHGQTPDGQRFLAMEWLEGHDLAYRLARGPLPLCDALLLMRRVAEALTTAHRRGVIHRDLKPTTVTPKRALADIVPRRAQGLTIPRLWRETIARPTSRAQGLLGAAAGRLSRRHSQIDSAQDATM